jgi:hypothetical protein
VPKVMQKNIEIVRASCAAHRGKPRVVKKAVKTVLPSLPVPTKPVTAEVSFAAVVDPRYGPAIYRNSCCLCPSLLALDRCPLIPVRLCLRRCPRRAPSFSRATRPLERADHHRHQCPSTSRLCCGAPWSQPR